MARKPVVTRQIVTTIATVLCLDLEQEKPIQIEFRLPRTYATEEKMMKCVKRMVSKQTIKPVHVISSRVEKIHYSMPEEQYVQDAEIIGKN